MQSLESAAKISDAKVICLAETKIGSTTPTVQGFTWIENKYRKNKEGGGVAILVRNDCIHLTKEVQGLETQDQEIAWTNLRINNNNIYIGVYYGQQEKVKEEIIEREFSQITTQINKLKRTGLVALMTDCNAKLNINSEEIQQEESDNGKIMKLMINNTNTKIPSIQKIKPDWTRNKEKTIDGRKIHEKSIIDYVITCSEMEKNITNIVNDQEGIYRIKGKKESDHNTFIIETSIPYYTKPTKQKILNTKDKVKWENFNNKFEEKYKEKKPTTYEELQEIIQSTMKEIFDTITIKKGIYKPKETQKIKELKEKRRIHRKDFEKAKKELKQEKKETYINTQKELRQAIEEEETKSIENRINRIIQEGGAKSNLFWKIRKQIIQGDKNKEEYDLIKENGEIEKDPEKAKEYIAEYFENLYQAREGNTAYEEWTREIEQKVEEIEKQLENSPPETPFSKKEISTVIQQLKKGKAKGQDGIPNEMFIYANDKTKNIIQTELNKILESQNIPEQWTEGMLKRIYKGKGTKGKCSNERGITIASNMGKFFERLINNRILTQVNMTEAQAGGRKGRATVDHILLLKELQFSAKKNKKEIIKIYLDVTKAYDKAWLKAIMYVLHKQGVQSRIWTLVKKLNSNLKTTIMTKYGNTREIIIRDSIRQGGVLSGLLYALLMDEINKDLCLTNKGINLPETEIKIPCLLWMDDVYLNEINKNNAQELLNTTYDVSQRYRVEFGMPKTNFIRSKNTKEKIELKIGENKIDETDKYTYLGEINNKSMNLKHQIDKIKGKIEGAYQAILTIAEDSNFRGIKMEAIWKMINACIIPIMTYACETWEPNKTEMKKLKQILDNILKRILKTPTGTPTETIYIETGFYDFETIMYQRRLGMAARLKHTDSELMKAATENEEGKWRKMTNHIMEKIRIEDHELIGTKEQTKNNIKEKCGEEFLKRIQTSE